MLDSIRPQAGLTNMSLLVVVFFVQLAIHILSAAGSSAINGLIWTLYSKLPTTHTQKAAALSKLRREVVDLNKQMNNTSAQDDFAKWAKLRRQHDKKKEEYDKISRELQDVKSSFDKYGSVAKWLITTGVRYLLQFWFSKQAMFWLPQGWVPHAGEWILSFPSAPLGSVSINNWWIACASVITLVSEVIMSLRSTMAESKQSVPLAQASGTGGERTETSSDEKKTL